MKSIAIAFPLILMMFLGGCQGGFSPQPLLQKVLILPYEDFVDDPVAPWIADGAAVTHVVIHYGQSRAVLERKYTGPGYRFATVRSALFYVSRRLRQLAEGTPEKARLRATFVRLRAFDNQRRAAASSVPPFAGRGSARRMTTIY